ncbi:DNA repair protein RecO [Sporanaerobium hydrogeniformans]|uniref:DNA repair protein RecO n=1 Tax=Sporanaerobium hydrogeniformans TaxID=3072179 RepID=UPI0015D4A030|nr:DNA repair protein RecO [Sporanaerobium hydrogeniformans]
MTIKTKALVIREYIVGESDKYVTLFTKDLGKIQALAPKAKKYSGGLATGTQLFVYGEFMLTQYKDTYRLLSVDILDMFHDLRKDLFCLTYSSYIVEFVAAVTEEALVQEELLLLTLITLKNLSQEEKRLRLVRRIFELRALSLLGFMPQIKKCVDCEVFLTETEQTTYDFHVEAGGILCSNCQKHYIHTLKISYGTLYTLRYIMATPVERLFKFEVSEQVLKELEHISEDYRSYYIDKSFKTLDFISKLHQLEKK